MPWTIETTTLKHTAANNYRCTDSTCPCQSAGVTDLTFGQPGLWALKPGSTDCAWCNKEAGREQGNESHGICKCHSDELIARAKARKEKRIRA